MLEIRSGSDYITDFNYDTFFYFSFREANGTIISAKNKYMGSNVLVQEQGIFIFNL